VLPAVALLNDPDWPSLTFADSPLQAVIGIIMVTCAVAAARATRRFAAVLLVGAIGYGMAALFIIQGAPDLAITQLLIETLGVVIFVMVVRHLPSHFPERPRTGAFRRSQIGRAVLAGAVGIFIFVFTLLAVGARQVPPISQEYMDKTLPEAGGHNVVNVIVVDFRGFDTMGEITVLAVAALGVAAIVGAGRSRPGSRGRTDDGEPASAEEPAVEEPAT
jgi:multicomponent Na+:H+ antiporter subunit A